MKKILVFLEFKDEAEEFINNIYPRLRGEDDILVITFHPVLKAILSNVGVPVMDSFNFCGVESHHRLITILQEYTDNLRSACSPASYNVINDVYVANLLFPLRGVLSSWIYRVEVISNAAERYKPDKIITFSAKDLVISKSAWTGKTERYLFDIAGQIAGSEVLVDEIKIDISGDNKIGKIFNKGIAKIIMRFGRLFSGKKSGKDMILIPDDGYNIKNIFNLICDRADNKFDLCFMGAPRSAGKSRIFSSLRGKKKMFRYLYFDSGRRCGISDELTQDKMKFRKDFERVCKKWSYRGASPAGYILKKYDLALEEEVIDKTFFQYVNIGDFFDRERTVCVFSQHSTGSAAVIGDLCRKRGISSVMVPHGSFPPVYDEYSKAELKESAIGMVDTKYQYLFFQTPLMEKFIEDIPVKSEKVITGPLIFGTEVKKGKDVLRIRKQFAGEDEKIILHASTFKGRTGQRFVTYSTVDEYVEEICTIIDCVDNLDRARLLIRFRPNTDMSLTDLKSVLPHSDKYSIVTDGVFLDYLAIADMVISFSSAALVEALQNDIPVLVYNMFNRYKYLCGMELNNVREYDGVAAVYNVNSTEMLPYALKWILNNHLSSEDISGRIYDEYKYKKSRMKDMKDFMNEIIDGENNKIYCGAAA